MPKKANINKMLNMSDEAIVVAVSLRVAEEAFKQPFPNTGVISDELMEKVYKDFMHEQIRKSLRRKGQSVDIDFGSVKAHDKPE